MSIRVSIGAGCNGMGSCVRLAPRVFRIDPATGKAEVLLDDCTSHRDLVMQAAHSCPFVLVEIDGVPTRERIDPATVIACERLTPDIVELRLRRPGFVFTPGQYVFLRLTDAQGEFFRTYSVVGSVDGIVSLCVRLVANGRAGQALAAIRPGVVVGLRPRACSRCARRTSRSCSSPAGPGWPRSSRCAWQHRRRASGW